MSFQDHFRKIFLEKDVFTDIIGQSKAKEQIKSALIMNRHILIYGPPGIGKTTLAKNIARLLPDIQDGDKSVKGEERLIRVQGSPDLTAEDLIGDIDPMKALEFGPLSKEAFQPGKIFQANDGILFFDEVNRCSEKLQNALLQALEEGFVTIGSYDVDLSANFIFIGTLNPHDSSTEKLSDAFLDRFDIIEMDYPETDAIEQRIVKSQAKTLDIDFPDELYAYMINFVRLLRDKNKVSKFPSVRASIGLFERASANAFLRGKSVVDMNDVGDAMISVLAHRIELKPSLKYAQSPEDFIKQQFEQFIKAEQIELDPSDEESDISESGDST